MNLFGSYRALLGNACAALSASIEIYNKPKIEYRDECSVILLVNAWELLLKAILSKKRKRIYYNKRRNEPYRTYSISDALNRATRLFPSQIDFDATAKNLELLVKYRDNAVHFYNSPGFGVIVYALAQTSITNFRDLVKGIFDIDIADEITLSLLPLSMRRRVDPIQFIRESSSDPNVKRSVREFTSQLRELVVELETQSCDTGRLVTVFQTRLESTKKIASADLVVGVQSGGGASTQILVQRSVDPNRSHPYRESDIISSVSDTSQHGMGISFGNTSLTQYPFRAIVYHFDVKDSPRYCWADSTGIVTRYSAQLVEFIRQLSENDVSEAIHAYQNRSTTA
jgi:hypothetical protein